MRYTKTDKVGEGGVRIPGGQSISTKGLLYTIEDILKLPLSDSNTTIFLGISDN